MVFNFVYFLGGSEWLMKEITIKHNGESINLTEDDVLRLWELVVDLIGEEIWLWSLATLNRTIILKNTWWMMMLILYKLTITASSTKKA